MNVWSPRILSVLRIVAALLFMEHGLMKLAHFPMAQPGAPDPLPAMMMAAAVIEIGAGILLSLGWWTRVAALICSGEMAVAYFLVHAPVSFWPGINGGEAAILYCFLFLYLAVEGGGIWSLDVFASTVRSKAGD